MATKSLYWRQTRFYDNGSEVGAVDLNWRSLGGGDAIPTGSPNVLNLSWYESVTARENFSVSSNNNSAVLHTLSTATTYSNTQTFDIGHGVNYDPLDNASGRFVAPNTGDIFEMTFVGTGVTASGSEVSVSDTLFRTFTIPSTAACFGAKWIDMMVLIQYTDPSAFEARGRNHGSYTSAYSFIVRPAATNDDVDDGHHILTTHSTQAFAIAAGAFNADRIVSIKNDNNMFSVRIGTSVINSAQKCYLSFRVLEAHY